MFDGLLVLFCRLLWYFVSLLGVLCGLWVNYKERSM